MQFTRLWHKDAIEFLQELKLEQAGFILDQFLAFKDDEFIVQLGALVE